MRRWRFPEARWIVWVTILIDIEPGRGFMSPRNFATWPLVGVISSADLLPDSDKLRLEGKLDENEYKNIKSKIAEQQKQIVNKEK